MVQINVDPKKSFQHIVQGRIGPWGEKKCEDWKRS